VSKNVKKNPPRNFEKIPLGFCTYPFSEKGDYPPRIFMDFYAKISANINRGILVGYPP